MTPFVSGPYRRTCAFAALLLGASALHAQPAASFPPIEKSISLPHDETAHRQPVEWWYMTGHLTGVDPQGGQRQYGFQLIILQASPVAGQNAIFTSHFAITDLQRSQFFFEHQDASGPVSPVPNRFDANVNGVKMGGSLGQYYAKAALADKSYAADLTFTAKVPVTLNGINGIQTEGDGSFVSPYYSYTALAAKGVVQDHGVPVKITGTIWYDHQWVNALHRSDGGGWTWFGVSMGDNTQYNISFLQDKDGKVVQAMGVKTAEGRYAPIPPEQLALQEMGAWKSPHTGYTYPQAWRVKLPGGTVMIVPKVEDAELHAPGHRFYYEAPASVSGTINGKWLTGNAFAEVNPRGVSTDNLLP